MQGQLLSITWDPQTATTAQGGEAALVTDPPEETAPQAMRSARTPVSGQLLGSGAHGAGLRSVGHRLPQGAKSARRPQQPLFDVEAPLPSAPQPRVWVPRARGAFQCPAVPVGRARSPRAPMAPAQPRARPGGSASAPSITAATPRLPPRQLLERNSSFSTPT